MASFFGCVPTPFCFTIHPCPWVSSWPTSRGFSQQELPRTSLPLKWGRRCFLVTVSQVISRFMKIYSNNLLQLSGHTESSKRFSIIFVIAFEVNIAAQQKQARLLTIVLYKFPLPLILLTTFPTAVPALDLFVKYLCF